MFSRYVMKLVHGAATCTEDENIVGGAICGFYYLLAPVTKVSSFVPSLCGSPISLCVYPLSFGCAINVTATRSSNGEIRLHLQRGS